MTERPEDDVVERVLTRAARLEAPPGLLDDVMADVRRAARPAAAPVRREGFLSLLSLFTPRLVAVAAFTFVAGLGLGLVLRQTPLDRSDTAGLSGTALPGSSLAGRDRPAQARTYESEGLKASASSRLERRLLVARVSIESDRAVEVRLVGEGYSPRVFAQDGPALGDVVLGTGLVRFTHPAGRRVYTVSYEPDGGRALVLHVGGGELLVVEGAR